MLGSDQKRGNMLCLISPDMRMPKKHPLRNIRRIADGAFKEMDEVLAGMYSRAGRPSITPERLLKSFILMALYSIRSERLFCAQLG